MVSMVRNSTLKHYSGRYPNSVDVVGGGSTASSEAKKTLRGVKESPNAYPLLRSIAEDLCIILDSCEVWFPPVH